MSVDGDCDSLVRVIVGDSVAVEVIYKVNTALQDGNRESTWSSCYGDEPQ